MQMPTIQGQPSSQMPNDLMTTAQQAPNQLQPNQTMLPNAIAPHLQQSAMFGVGSTQLAAEFQVTPPMSNQSNVSGCNMSGASEAQAMLHNQLMAEGTNQLGVMNMQAPRTVNAGQSGQMAPIGLNQGDTQNAMIPMNGTSYTAQMTGDAQRMMMNQTTGGVPGMPINQPDSMGNYVLLGCVDSGSQDFDEEYLRLGEEDNTSDEDDSLLLANRMRHNSLGEVYTIPEETEEDLLSFGTCVRGNPSKSIHLFCCNGFLLTFSLLVRCQSTNCTSRARPRFALVLGRWRSTSDHKSPHHGQPRTFYDLHCLSKGFQMFCCTFVRSCYH
jgi:hypothetical protein